VLVAGRAAGEAPGLHEQGSTLAEPAFAGPQRASISCGTDASRLRGSPQGSGAAAGGTGRAAGSRRACCIGVSPLWLPIVAG
jgi:hypothetical protein